MQTMMRPVEIPANRKGDKIILNINGHDHPRGKKRGKVLDWHKGFALGFVTGILIMIGMMLTMAEIVASR